MAFNGKPVQIFTADNAVSNSNPLPVTVTTAGAGSVSIAPNVAGSFDAAACGSGSAHTFIAPAKAVGFILENEATTSFPIRWVVGTTATSSVGNYYEAGRDTGLVPIASDVSVIGVGGTANVTIQWVLSA